MLSEFSPKAISITYFGLVWASCTAAAIIGGYIGSLLFPSMVLWTVGFAAAGQGLAVVFWVKDFFEFEPVKKGDIHE
jgi:hypothetical protein